MLRVSRKDFHVHFALAPSSRLTFWFARRGMGGSTRIRGADPTGVWSHPSRRRRMLHVRIDEIVIDPIAAKRQLGVGKGNRFVVLATSDMAQENKNSRWGPLAESLRG